MKKYIWATLAFVAVIMIFSIGYQRYKTPLVSVVMLTYKRADIAPKAIESILNQNYKNFEFIILNDGSPDNTDEVIAEYLKKDSRIRYYKNEKNKGIAYSRNRVAELARGKYIAIMDDDDESLPDRIEEQAAYLENHPEITAVAGQIIGLPRIPLNHNEIATGLIQYNNFGNSNVMYRRQFAKNNKIKYNTKLKASEDWDFWLKMLFAGAKFAALTQDLHIRHGDSIKHYKTTYEAENEPIRQNVARFFSPENSESFYQADACEKLNMIAKAPMQIFTKDYLAMLLKSNCP